MWPLLILSEIAIAFIVAQRGMLRAKAQGYLELIRGLRNAVRARRAIGARSQERLLLLDLLTDDVPAFEKTPPRLALIGKRILTGYLQAAGIQPMAEGKDEATSGAGRTKEA
jgi:hypothetical protein